MRVDAKGWSEPHRFLMIAVLVAAFLMPPLFFTLALAVAVILGLALVVQACAVRVPALLLSSARNPAGF